MLKRMEVAPSPLPRENLWDRPGAAVPELLGNAVDGSLPRFSTSVALFYDPGNLYVLFRAEDEPEAVSTFRARDEPLYQEDVVEVFLSPSDLLHYFEIEVSPIGTIFDALVHSPEGIRRSMEVDRSWSPSGLWTAVRRSSEGPTAVWDTLLTVPFDALGRGTPAAGESWRANFYRIDRSIRGDEFSAWSPTEKNPPDFHVPACFGQIVFV